MAIINTVGIFSKPGVAAANELVPMVFSFLREKGLNLRFDSETAQYCGCGDEGLPREQVPDGCDLVIVMGGDGTLLSASRAIHGRAIPLLAVNLGGLGFLTAITKEEVIPELSRVLRGEDSIAKRKLLRIDVIRRGEKIGCYEALNDVVITKSAIARMIDIEALVDGMFVCSYKADGLIIATPTGSTAYSLSAGGPIIYPSVSAFCITPICPHTLTNRPLVVSGSSVITVICKSDSSFLTIDGQVGEPIDEGDRIECRAADSSLHLIRPPKQMFFDVLRQKLKWGER